MRKKKKKKIRKQIDREIKTQSDTEATALQHKQRGMTSVANGEGRRGHPREQGSNYMNIPITYLH